MKIKLLLGLSILLVQMAQSQKVDAKELTEYQNKIMSERLDLSEKQQEQIMVHNAAFSEKQAALMNKEGSMFSKIGDVKKMRKERAAELKKILSEEQLEIFEDEIAPELRSYMKSKMKG